jgi:tetratricopeptide (TPR) repeat protein
MAHRSSSNRPYTFWFTAGALLLLLLFVRALPAVAQTAVDQQTYELSMAKGLVKFGDSQYAEAEALFRLALKAKPGDFEASDYLGQTLIRSRKYSEAEEIYQRLLKADPSNAKAMLGLGIAQYHQGKYKEALANFSNAEKALTEEPLVYYYQGLTHSQIGEYNQAIQRFARTMAFSPELAPDAHYQSGIAYFKQNISDEAKAEFEEVIKSEPPESELAKSAREYLRQIAAIKPEGPKKWDLTLSASQQYDSNVIVLPNGVSTPGGVGISRKYDYVTALYGRGEYRAVQTDKWIAGMSYSFFQNFHQTLSAFDVQDHTPTVFVQYNAGRVQTRLQYVFDYITVGRAAYAFLHTFNPVVTIAESQSFFTQIQAKYQYQDYQPDRFAFNPTRNGTNWLVGVTQFYLFAANTGNVRLGYTFDANVTGGGSPTAVTPGTPRNSDWSYKGHRFTVGVGLPPVLTIKADANFDYYLQQYDNANSFSLSGTTVRRDNIYIATGTLSRDLTANLSLAFQYNYTRDQNNIPVFDYNRSVFSLILAGRF